MNGQLSPENEAELQQLLTGMMAADNKVRSQAESQLNQNWVHSNDKQRPQMLLVYLASQATTSKNGDVINSFAAVLYRRIASSQPEGTSVSTRILDTVSPESLLLIRQVLLQGLFADHKVAVRHKIADAIGETARESTSASQKAQWPDLLDALFSGVLGPSADIRECCLRIFSAVPRIVRQDVLSNIVPILAQTFQDKDLSVRLASVSAFNSFFQTLDKSSWKMLTPLLPDLLNILTPLRAEYQNEELATVLESLIDLAGIAPRMFRHVFKTILQFCIDVCKDKNLESNARLSALELLITFVDEAPGMCKKEEGCIPALALQCLQMMTEIAEDDDQDQTWLTDDHAVTEDDSEEYSAAKHSLDRMALKLGGETLVPHLFRWLPTMITSVNWRERHAALMAISNIAEGCRDVLITDLSSILDSVVPCVNDSVPRVQWAACNALGQMSTDFSDVMQMQHHDKVVPALISKLSASVHPRVQAHAAAALVNFSESASNSILEPYLDSLIQSLMVLLQSPKTYVQEQVLTTIAIIADAAESKFVRYYDALMPPLINVIKANTTKEQRLIKAKSIECTTLIALAVGKERSAADCRELVTLFANLQMNIVEPDDPCQSYLNHAWSRICKIIGKDFLPYIGGVVPPLLEMAKTKPDIQVVADDELDTIEQQEGWEVIPIQGKYIGINTSLLDEKASAIELLGGYAAVLKEDFAPFVKEVLENVVIPSLSFFYNESVRYSATQALVALMEAAQMKAMAEGADNSVLVGLWQPALEKLIAVLPIEPVPEILNAFYCALYQSLTLLGPGSIVNSNNMDSLIKCMVRNLSEILQKEEKRQASGSAEQNDDDAYTEGSDDDSDEALEDELLNEMSKVIQALFKTSRASFLPVFDQITPILSTMINSNNVDFRQWALFVADDLVEYCGPDSWNYKDLFFPKMVDSLVDGDAPIRQAAAYGIGVCAQHGGDAFTQSVIDTLGTLFRITYVPEARSEENVHATENASVAIAKILSRHGKILGDKLTEANAEWLRTLPIVEDHEAAPFAYLYLATLIEKRDASVVNQPEKVFSSIAEAFIRKSIQGKTIERTSTALRSLLSCLPEPTALNLLASIPAENQDIVKAHIM